jgi:hypothetical protein
MATSFPSVTFSTTLPPIVRKEFEALCSQLEGFLRAAGFNADGSFVKLLANQIVMQANPELAVGGDNRADGSITIDDSKLFLINQAITYSLPAYITAFAGGVAQGAGHPQGVLAANRGQVYRNIGNDRLYQKIAGVSGDAWGWYPVHDVGHANTPAWSGFNIVEGNTAQALSRGYLSSLTVAGSVSSDDAAVNYSYRDDGYYDWLRTSTAAGNIVQVISNQTNQYLLRSTWDFDYTFRVRTSTDITGLCFWVGFRRASITNSDVTTSNAITFRYATVAGDAGWVGYSYSASAGAGSATAVVASITTDALYLLRIRRVGSTLYFSVNNGAEVAKTTHVPNQTAAGSGMFLAVGCCNRSAGGAGTDRALGITSGAGFVGES